MLLGSTAIDPLANASHDPVCLRGTSDLSAALFLFLKTAEPAKAQTPAAHKNRRLIESIIIHHGHRRSTRHSQPTGVFSALLFRFRCIRFSELVEFPKTFHAAQPS